MSPAKRPKSASGRAKKTSSGGSSARKAAAKKTSARKAAAKKTAAKTSRASSARTGGASGAKKKTAVRKTTARKSSARKSTARKSTARKTTARKTTARKPVPRKTTAGKTTAGKSARKTTARNTTARTPTAATAAANARRSRPQRDGGGRLDRDELADVRRTLEAERAELRRQQAELEQDSFDGTQSDLTGEVGLDEDFADAGTATFDRERDLSIRNNIRDLLDQIERALERIDEGTYGTCERCGRPIDTARLKALPHASLCMDCKRREERAR